MYTPEKIKKSVREAGIVGAGGAGFPTYVKYNACVDTVIVNAAECEPLLRVDQQLAARETEKLLKGLELACIATGASRGIVGIKGKYKKAISSIENVLKTAEFSVPIAIHLLKNYYPAGDEHVLVYDVTGKIVPEGGIPLEVGVVVNNVNTLLNVADSMKGLPVTDRPLTITGEVQKPVTVRLPVGTSVRDAIAVAGGATVKDFVVVSGGPMMG
ncbi:MAG: SLBB domain-containing protein, partial [Candidatus Eremiobacterota bacterium]